MNMNIFSKIAEWFCYKYKTLTAPRYTARNVADEPKDIKAGTLYIVIDGDDPDTIIFKCPCGCNADIYLNLLKDARPNWSFCVNQKGKITISPSIWRKAGCKSHFFIRNGKVSWA